MQTVYRYWVTIIFLAVIVQVAFAGFGAFSVAGDVDDGGSVNDDRFEDVFGLHAGFGYLIGFATIILLVLALVGRLGKRRILQSAALVGLLVLQIVLAEIGFDVAAIGALHPVNALAIFSLSGYLTAAAWRTRETAVATAPAT